MTTLEFVLMIAALVGLAATWRQSPRWLNFMPFGIGVLAATQLIKDGYNANMLPVYLLIIVLGIIATNRLPRRRQAINKPQGKTRLYLGIVGTILGFLALFLGVRATIYQNLPPAKFSRMSWSEAFKATHRKLSHQYAFGAWKQIDWETLYAIYVPQIVAAEAANDRQAYYRALLGYTSSIPDGHVWLDGEDFGSREADIGAGYGLEILSLSDGRVIAVVITPGGAADDAGMQWGAEILTWDDLSIQAALEATPILWPLRRGAPATLEGRRLEQLRLLVRAPAGSNTSVSFRNPSDNQVHQANLTAIYDGVMAQDGNSERPLPPVEPGVILPGGIGYIKINNEHDDADRSGGGIFLKAVESFIREHVAGLILDVRGNRGGDDQLVPQFVGHFVTQRTLYEKITVYFQPLDIFIPCPPDLWIEPLEPNYAGAVVVLIDNATFSSGEGIPMAIARLPQGEVIGFYGTYGSFGMTGGIINLPEGLILHFPDGQSLDAQNAIQLDSDHTLQGGFAPTIHVPMTEEAARAIYVDRSDYLLEVATQYLQDQ